MRVLVLGASGMLGHKAMQELGQGNETWGSVRPEAAEMLHRAGFSRDRLLVRNGLPNADELRTMVEEVTPDVVINCIGAVKRVPAAQDPIHAIRINSLFPHEVASACAASGARFIHVSTDCVFSGATGMYSEADRPDAEDLYGRAKLLGEVTEPHLTLRTSIIGRELMGQHGLLEWFLSQEEAVRGYRLAFFSGLTTLALARVLDSVINDHPRLAGLFHVAAARIDKFSLLEMLNAAFMKGLAIIPDDEVAIDRSLDGGRFERLTGIAVPSWEQMITQMADESTELGYEKIRQLTDRGAEASS